MRTFFLGMVILCEILIVVTNNTVINEHALSLLASMIVVVVVAFTFSAILNNFKSIELTRNYTISGIVGVVVGILFYFWVANNIKTMLEWLQNYGLYILLILIFVSVLVLYFYKGRSINKSTVPMSSEKEHGAEINSESNPS